MHVRTLVFAALLLVSCALLTAGASFASDSPTPPPGFDRAFFDYDASQPFPVTERPFGTFEGFDVTVVTYPSAVVTPYPADNTVTAYLFLPPGSGPHPAMVTLHEWNPDSVYGGFILSAAVCRAGVAALMVVEPFSLNRRPAGDQFRGFGQLSGDPPQLLQSWRQGVIDARRGLDYLSKRPDIDPSRLGVGGLSLGAILSGLVAGADPRVKVVMDFAGGADFARGFWNGLLTLPYRRTLVQRGYTYETFAREIAPLDADNWLPERHFDPANALLFDGRYDIAVLPGQARHLSRDLGGAHIVWADTGHYGLLFAQKQGGAIATQFLRSRFFADPKPFHPPNTLPAKTIKLGFLVGGHEGGSPLLAYQLLNFDDAGRFSVDGNLTLHGVSLGLSVKTSLLTSLGLEFPLLHGAIKPRPYFMVHFVL